MDYGYLDYKTDEERKAVAIEELRQVAIKWIKEIALADKLDISKIEFKTKKIYDYSITYNGEFYTKEGDKVLAQIGWIMHFFNITDEDLK